MIENSKKNIFKQKDWWTKLNWTAIRVNIKTYQEEIIKSSRNGKKRKMHKLMKKLVKSEYAKLYAIYIVTQKNKGKFTPGIDGKIYLSPEDRMSLSREKFNYKNYKFHPIIVKELPKKSFERKNGKIINKNQTRLKSSEKRQIGIMTIKDRIMTKIISFALSARWEPKFDSNIIGFRPGKSIKDAIYGICRELSKGKEFILKADIKDFFNNINHNIILDNLNIFHGIIKRFLNIKVVAKNTVYMKNRGVIQGSPLSPLLSNIALNGMHKIFDTQVIDGKFIEPKSRIFFIRYADDIAILAPSKRIIKKWVLPRLRNLLEKRGLRLNLEKTQIISIKEGFQFLGYHIKQIDNKIIAKSTHIIH